MQRDPARARAEIVKHLAGDLGIAPVLGAPGQRLAEVTEALKPHYILIRLSPRRAWG